MRRLLTKRLLYVIGAVSLIALIGMIQPAMALEGPALIPPLGVNVDDSEILPPEDPGYGEEWGRDGGRMKTFTIFEVSEYDQLKWRPVNVGIAFDGAIDAASENLSYNSIVDGKAVWVGQTQVEVLNETTSLYELKTVNTEFILTVKDAYNSNSLVSFEFMDGIPTVDLTALTPIADEVSFAATLEMRVQMPPHDSVTGSCPYADLTEGEYFPALDVFDCLQTNPANERPAITTFEYGFFYDLDLPSLGLSGHDIHMEALVSGVQGTADQILGWTDFFSIEFAGRTENVMDEHEQTQVSVGNLQTTVNDLGGTLTSIWSTVNSLQCDYSSEFQSQSEKLEEIRGRVDEMPEMLLLMFGLTDFMQNQELAGYWDAVESTSPIYQNLNSLNGTLAQVNDQTNTNAHNISDILTQLSDLKTALGGAAEIDIQVKDFQWESKGKEAETLKRFIVLLKENGNPVDGNITSIDAIVDGGGTSVEPIVGFTAIWIGRGLYEVQVPLAASLDKVKILFIRAENGTSYGSKLFTVGIHTE